MQWFSQISYTLRLDWGWEGARRAAVRGDLLVVVDTLRFSTTVAVAASRGVQVVPIFWSEEASVQVAKKYLSPALMQTAEFAPGSVLTLPSPNGATCCQHGKTAAGLLVGSIINAKAVANAVEVILRANPTLGVTILACGERWDEENAGEDGALRFALEDYMGAGAILFYLPLRSSSPECKAARAAFRSAKNQLYARLLECGSGVELVEKGYTEDVKIAASLNSLDVVPVWQEGIIRSR